ncbi:unnamed protein product [Peronospora destructor]|uniref:RNA helicase n=1 Tax=Peronospora destructor TaxID=86335 RepID=A0AAV0TZN0_9STRA|nr:unnamed protein product [Peronospora destructor]
MNNGDGGRAYVPRRKRRRKQPPPLSTELHDNKSFVNSPHEASATQETSWARQERGIVVEGEGSIPPPILSFSEFPLSRDAILVLQSRGVTKPSAVQAQALPCISQGRDVVALAPTGSGKTLCYILPMLELLQRQPYRSTESEQYAAMPWMVTAPCALVVVPTRELADQVVQDFSEFFCNRTTPPVVGIYGGIAVDEQLSRLSRHAYDAMVVVATPGRLLHLLLRHRASLSLGQISLLVIDEVDRVLEFPEMETQLRDILQLANPAGRQTLLFSATLPVFLPRMARSAVLRPITIRVDEASMPSQNVSALSSGTRNTSAVKLALSTTSNVVHNVQFMRPAEKPSRLLRVLRTTEQPPVLVFCNSRSSVERVARLLRNEQFHVAPLHGGQSQGYRTQALRAFRAGYVDVLVATDLASRGLNFPGGGIQGADTGGSNVTGKATSFLTRECTIAMELKQVLRAAMQSVPRELDIPRNFSAGDTQASSSHKH